MENNYSPKFWIEKTIVKERPDRNGGDRALGMALWSPQVSKDGSDIYKNMRAVSHGDIIFHLIDNKIISGISKVKKSAIETIGIEGTDWNGASYLIELENYVALNPPIDRNNLLNKTNESELLRIANLSEVFYNKDLNLRQGAYLTPCNLDLVKLIAKIYKEISSENLPHIGNMDYQNNITFNKSFLLTRISNNFEKIGLQINDKLICRFTASLITKPFVILTGLSGSGKTKLAQSFAKWICENKKQYCIVPVGADWTNREPLLGFPNALEENKYVKPDNGVLDLIIAAVQNPDKPYFLILDEMNLSHVERYFADFLSVMESKDRICIHSGENEWDNIPAEISFPKNLFIIGTVNIDETTYMFSPKVLDRANVIEFRVTGEEMKNFMEKNSIIEIENPEGLGAEMADSFVLLAKDVTLKSNNKDKISEVLINFFHELKKTGAEFGYRTASEIMRFAAVVNKIAPEWETEQIVDAAVMQKLLPKVHGSRRKLESVLITLGTLCLKDNLTFDSLLKEKSDVDFNDNRILYPISLEKILRMYHNLISNSFTSYAEA